MACPDPEILAEMAEERLPSSEREAVLDHAAGCDDCRHVLLILGTSRPAAASTPVRSWIPWAAAAGIVLSIVGLLLLATDSTPPTESLRASRTIPLEPEPPKLPSPIPPPSPKPEEPRPEPRSTPAPQPAEPKPGPEGPVTPAPEKPATEPTPSKPAPAPEPARPTTVAVVARLDRFDGEVLILNGPAKVPGKPGQEIRHGEGLECRGARSWALVSAPDRTRLELEGDTVIRELFAREAAKGRRLFIEKGAVRAEVSKQPAGEPMVFDTPHGEARVLGTILRLQIDPDPKKGTRLEVEEGRVELKNAAGRSVLVDAGHVAVAAAGIAPAAKRLPREEVLFSYDFEDGKRPASVSKGIVERGPDRRLCLSGEADPAGGSRLFIGDDAEGLFTCAGDEVLSFDYWVDAQASSVNLSLWNRTQKQPHEGGISKVVPGKWTHISVKLAEVGDPGTRLKEGDWAVSLLLQATGSPPRRFYVDNVTLTRSRSIRLRPSEAK